MWSFRLTFAFLNGKCLHLLSLCSVCEKTYSQSRWKTRGKRNWRREVGKVVFPIWVTELFSRFFNIGPYHIVFCCISVHFIVFFLLFKSFQSLLLFMLSNIFICVAFKCSVVIFFPSFTNIHLNIILHWHLNYPMYFCGLYLRVFLVPHLISIFLGICRQRVLLWVT